MLYALLRCGGLWWFPLMLGTGVDIIDIRNLGTLELRLLGTERYGSYPKYSMYGSCAWLRIDTYNVAVRQ
jgi:hypothetical protein